MTSTAPTFVKVYGLQRSGTNWMKFLLEANFDDVIAVDLPLGSKHELPRPKEALEEWRHMAERPIDTDRVPYTLDQLEGALTAGDVRAVVVIKPLLPWLVSFFRYRRLKERDAYPELTPDLAGRWTRRWIDMNAALVTSTPAFGWRSAIVDYHALLEHFDRAMRSLQQSLELGRAGDAPWVSSDRAMRRSTDEMHQEEVVSDRPFRRSYYLQGAYREELGGEVLAAVRRAVEAGEVPGALRPLIGDEAQAMSLGDPTA